jgi:hypothetical protein
MNLLSEITNSVIGQCEHVCNNRNNFNKSPLFQQNVLLCNIAVCESIGKGECGPEFE